ncbi:unnamed protein product [Symbiodinium pilosum]|uniref:Uncharacterized protein n=1 Tax=Symbiodinium pilosum TaxID=2952 RepID=A0A812TRP9_SYMPI|nr:unnamed protein product [Symbiodinium pilosum]
MAPAALVGAATTSSIQRRVQTAQLGTPAEVPTSKRVAGGVARPRLVTSTKAAAVKPAPKSAQRVRAVPLSDSSATMFMSKPVSTTSGRNGVGSIGKAAMPTFEIQRVKEIARRSEGTIPALHATAASPRHSGVSVEGRTVASVKEKQMAELRAQVKRCGLPVSKGPAAMRAPVMGRFGHQAEEECSRSPSQAPASPWPASPRQAPALEEELAWAVEQMEMHRRQIEAHQRQLSILERRHAELVTALREPSSRGTGVGKLFSREESLTGPSGSGLSGLSGLSFSEVASTTSSTSLGFACAVAAAEARLGRHGEAQEAQRQARLLREAESQTSETPGADDVPRHQPTPGQSGPEVDRPAKLTASEPSLHQSVSVPELLRELQDNRPMLANFVPCNVSDDSPGLQYLYGSLEVRLFSENGRLLVRVAPNGRTLEVNDFLARVEVIEAKRRWAWTIAEETEAINETPKSQAGALPLEAEAKEACDSHQPKNSWKHFFKAHWP